MNFHEYQAKELFAQYGIAVPPGKVANSPDAAVDAAKALGGTQWMVKAQIHAGGRGKSGGVKFCRSFDDVRAAAKGMLGTNMETYQSAGRALPVNLVLVTDATDIARELYLSILVDRDSKAISFIASKHGGVDIEQVARETPEDIHTIVVDFVEGLQPYQCRQLGFAMDLNNKQVNQLTKIMLGLYKLFNEQDLALVELNPLAVLEDGNLAALDGKVNSDDNAEFRHPNLAAMRDLTQEDAAEAAAQQSNLNYVTMDGNIGCMVNGAGLAMATMDVIKLAGGEPAWRSRRPTISTTRRRKPWLRPRPEEQSKHERSRKQRHQGAGAGFHRPAGHLPRAAVPRLRHQDRRRRDPGQGRFRAHRPARVQLGR